MQRMAKVAGAPSDIFPGTGCTLMHCAQDAHWCIAHSCNFDASWWHFSSAGFEASELALPVLSASCTCYPPLSLLRRAVHCTLGGRLKCNNNIYLMPTVSLNESPILRTLNRSSYLASRVPVAHFILDPWSCCARWGATSSTQIGPKRS